MSMSMSMSKSKSKSKSKIDVQRSCVFSILLVSCVMWSGASDSSDLLQSCSTISLA